MKLALFEMLLLASSAFARCGYANGRNVSMVSFNYNNGASVVRGFWFKKSSNGATEWINSENAVVGKEGGRDDWSVYFENYQVDLHTKKIKIIKNAANALITLDGEIDICL